jgi:hypothetical protein
MESIGQAVKVYLYDAVWHAIRQLLAPSEDCTLTSLYRVLTRRSGSNWVHVYTLNLTHHPHGTYRLSHTIASFLLGRLLSACHLVVLYVKAVL